MCKSAELVEQAASSETLQLHSSPSTLLILYSCKGGIIPGNQPPQPTIHTWYHHHTLGWSMTVMSSMMMMWRQWETISCAIMSTLSSLLALEVVIRKTSNANSNTVNSLAPGRFQFNFRKVIFKLTLVNGGWGISYEITLRWMPQDLTDDKSTLVQVMAWCR